MLPGWTLKSAGAYASSVSLMSDLGVPSLAGEVIRRQPAVSLDVPIQRHSLLYVAPDFLGYMLAVGLCIMSLLITHSRDDLILAAVVSAGGNFVFIAGKLPVTAMAGFIGNLQLIVFLGILYVVAADELIDVHLLKVNDRLSGFAGVVVAQLCRHDLDWHFHGSFHDPTRPHRDAGRQQPTWAHAGAVATTSDHAGPRLVGRP